MNSERIELLKDKLKIKQKELDDYVLDINNDYLSEEAEQIRKEIYDLQDKINKREKNYKFYKLGETPEEFEKLFGNTPINDIEAIKKYIYQNYIQKSKIKEKIVELDNMDSEYSKKIIDNNAFTLTELVKQVLQELMEEK